MEVLLFSLNATLPVILCMALGMALRATKRITPDTVANLSSLAFSLFMPTLSFYNVYNIDFHSQYDPRLILFAPLGLIGLTLLLVAVLTPILRDRRWVCACTHVGFRSNYVIFGIPIAQNMYGDLGARVATMLVPVAVIPFNLIAVILFCAASTKQGDPLGKVLKTSIVGVAKNPIIVGSMLGMVASLSGFAMPAFLYGAVRNIAVMASPLCLIILGAQITVESMRNDRARVLTMCAVRLIAAPAIAVPIAVLMGFRGAELAVLFILFSAPCATSCVIMARQYGVFPEFTAQVSGLTTVLSGFTVFVGITLLRWIGLF